MSPPTTTDRYERTGFTLVSGLIGPELVGHLSEYASILRATDRFEVDHQVPGSLRRYGAPAFEAVLKTSTAALSEAAGRRLQPTYSFARIYLRGQELVAHRDRPECEHSATVHLSSSEPYDWPICLRRGTSPPESMVLRPGDAVLYRGDELLHWRDPLAVDWYLQLFLHYVDAEGAHSDRAFDGRSSVGMPRKR
jgi:hypothetical protein